MRVTKFWILILFLLSHLMPVHAQQGNKQLAALEQKLDKYEIEGLTTQIEKTLSTAVTSKNSYHQIHALILKSRLAYIQGDFQQAKALINQANATLKKDTPKEILIKLLTWKGRYHIEWLELESADSSLQKAKQLLSQDLTDISLLSAEVNYTLGLLKIAIHEYQQADSIFTALVNNPKLERAHIQLFFLAKNQLAESKIEHELLPLADSILQSLQLEVLERLGKDHMINAYVYNYLGRLYSKKNKFQQAKSYFEKSLSIIKVKQGVQHPYYGKVLSNYGNLFLDIEDLAKAEEKLLQSITIYKKTFGNTPSYARALAPLEILYQKLGQPEKELKYALEQKNILQQSTRFSDYARSVNNLSYIYQDQKKYDQANALLEEGISRLKKEKQTQIGIYAILLMNYAGLNIDLGNYEKSEKSFEDAQELLANIYGKEHPWYAAVINNLASLYETTGKYKQAKKLYIETEEIDRTTLGTKHPYYIHTTYNLAKINRLTQDISSTNLHYQTANNGQIDLIYNYYSGFDEATRLDYLKKTEEGFNRFYSFVYDNYKTLPELGKTIQNLNLAVKNLALDFSADNQAVASEIKDSTIAKKYQDWLAAKKQLAQSYIQSPEEQVTAGINLEELEEQAELLEKELIRNEVIATSKLASKKRTAFEDLKSHIGIDEAVIDFIRFPYYAPDRLTDSVFYGALINRKDFEQPKLIWIGEEKQLKRLFRSSVRQNGSNYIENDRINQNLYTQIWQPLSPYLKGIKNINISASGLLYKVAFAALSTNGIPLLKQYNFTYYGNLRTFGKVSNEQLSQKSIALFGGANFNLDSVSLTQIAREYQHNIPINISAQPDELLVTTDTDNTRSAVVFNYLVGTKKEVVAINEQFQNKNWRTKTFLSNTALEENFKWLNGQKAPSILHIATHGYFFAPLKEGRKVPDNARGRIMSAKNPLLRSGLAFTGANYSWKLGKRIPNLEDGILTAYEIANQNLSNTNLVVLSACETGLGDVVNSGGVFGLQRAFKIAGVKNMLISLWKVPDTQTQELMTVFYEYYLQSYNASNALHQAQLKMSQKYRPFYWAGFILAK